jgi:hypothetical protein
VTTPAAGRLSDRVPALAAAAERLRDVPGFPRQPGRPRKHAADGHVSGHADNAVAQPRAVTSENGCLESAGVRQTRVVALEPSARAVVTVAPALLSVADAGVYLGGLSVRTVEGYIAAGILSPVRLPSPRGGRYLGRVLLERAELERLVAQARRRS